MRRHAFAGAAAVLLLAAASASAEEPPLRTAVDGTFAPHAMPSLSGGYEGFNIDLANEIAKRLHRRITIDAAQYSGLLPALQAGTYDFIAAPTTVTKERAENLLFTEGYLNTDFQFLIKKGAPKVEKLEDLKGKVVAVNKGSAYDSWARDLEPKIGWKVESFGTQTDAVQAVLAGRADANVAGNTAIAWAAKNNPQLELSYYYSTGLVWAAPLRKDSTELRKQLENAIECMKLDATIAKMHKRWFGIDPQPGSAAVTVFPGYGVPNMQGYDPTEHTPKCD
ncbi:MAG: transporter substrate-binding domain-containing protein [Alphaproteobacteria bacterium]|nr:MAG: transporter substrate-binding domain-containing protein [Alphaproteobacteria bacterium]TMJ55567.1 MAG: transporter substrate-binding domain-containing protein [Alphaproteobacteria bacterium]HYS87043.1 transporter substrate-binding domain-containing protein [Bradyrhizobium sp.]